MVEELVMLSNISSIYMILTKNNYSLFEGRLKSSYGYVISAVDEFLTNRIQALQHRWKKCVDCKGDCVEK